MKRQPIGIRVNGTTLYLDANALGSGQFRLESGTLSEQCDGCGEDIAETGALGKIGPLMQPLRIVCGCGVEYTIKQIGG